jgi:hypothetical protein
MRLHCMNKFGCAFFLTGFLFSFASTWISLRHVFTVDHLHVSFPNVTEYATSKLGPYAYAYVVAGCDPEQPSYRSYLYNIAIGTRILRLAGSRADVVVMIQMAHSSLTKKLPEQDARLLEAMKIRTLYLPPSPHESFYRSMMSKFLILGFTQYKRVIFLDADVLPVADLDFLMELSEKGILEENLIVMGRAEPANGGFFMLKPYHGALDEINQLIQRRRESGKRYGYPYFDPVSGWGHVIENDSWQSKEEKGTNWTFWAAFADQGLLYHWTKYHRQSVSIAKGKRVENWGNNGTLQLLKVLKQPFLHAKRPIYVYNEGCLSKRPACGTSHLSIPVPDTCLAVDAYTLFVLFGNRLYALCRQTLVVSTRSRNVASSCHQERQQS